MRNGVLYDEDDGRYGRYMTGGGIGAVAGFRPRLFDENGNYLVDPGETWAWVWERTDIPEEIARADLTYSGGDNHCWSDDYCGTLAWVAYTLEWPCMPEGDYKVTLFHNGAVVGSGVFKPVRFKPHVDYVGYAGSSIEPKRWKSSTGQATEVGALIVDDLHCGYPIKAAEVTLASTVVGGSNGHVTLINGDIGTGQFESVGFNSTLNPDGPQQNGTAIKGEADANGFYKARYRAKDHGALETLTVNVKRPATETDPEVAGGPASTEIQIKITGLVEVTSENAPVIFSDGGSCPHSVLPHWLTGGALSRLHLAAQIYLLQTGNKLSLNDASLPMGGVIDNKLSAGGGRDAACHVSHRQGIDLDINLTDSGGVNMARELTVWEGTSMTYLRFLTKVMQYFGVEKAREEPVHYRFPN